jgi:hypothetical protein
LEEKISKRGNIDWMTSEGNDSIEKKVPDIEIWTTEVKKTLRAGGSSKNFGKINNLEG